MTVRDVFDVGMWDEYCEASGCNPWAMNEGRVNDSTRVSLDDLPPRFAARLAEAVAEKQEREAEAATTADPAIVTAILAVIKEWLPESMVPYVSWTHDTAELDGDFDMDELAELIAKRVYQIQQERE